MDRAEPDWSILFLLTSAHLQRIPFENVSKIYRARVQGIREIPELEEFIDNVESRNFGGTCYTNNYYVHLLLRHLGYNVRLYSADIGVSGESPDSHMVNVVTLWCKEFIVDVGYGAPFWQPIPRDSGWLSSNCWVQTAMCSNHKLSPALFFENNALF